ncbi:MAG TPA: VWA domain-containing protein [Gemmatimonadales bacterium]|nr:VWA domain-containing protein [Gemmatimonadales bacterium]
MAEPEDVLAEGALQVARLARELWGRHLAGHDAAPPGLRDLRRRLELFAGLVFPGTPEIGIAEPPAPPSWLGRLARRSTAHLHSPDPIAASDGERIFLPADLPGMAMHAIPDRYRLLALEQAARLERGTHRYRPEGDALLRDLYLLSEAAAIDGHLVRLLPRLTEALREARREALARRPVMRRASPREAAVETMLGAVLRAHPAEPASPVPLAPTPADSLAWAREESRRLAPLAGPYRGIAPVPLWGSCAAPREVAVRGPDAPDGETPQAPGRSRTLPRRPRVRETSPDEDDAEPGTWMVRADDLQEKAEDPAGLSRPADRDQEADPGELAEDLSELPELRLVRTPGPVHEVLAGEVPIPRAPHASTDPGSGALAFPEWDWRTNAYRPRAAVVREVAAPPGSDQWVERELRRHAPIIRAVRRDFERLRPRRTAIGRQPDGTELDIDAVVDALADRTTGRVGDDRLYIESRPVRRDAAIALLVDASASTDGWVAGDRRIIDVEKEALLIVREALAALGDAHAIFAFASAGPSRVTVQVLKPFGAEVAPTAARSRIAGLEPDGFTRVGAALRYTTAVLARQPARHRLLLLLSDGRPNDVDEYEGRYGLEDTRVAVAEARLQGVHLFCLTVDRQAPRYAPRLFGRDYAVLSRPERLPLVLTTLLRQLIAS